MNFESLFEGIFENADQSKSGSQWSWIVIKNKKLEDGMFECSQAYKFDEENPYRKSVVKIVYGDEQIIVRNYDSETLEYKQGCDVKFTQEPDGSYYGRNTCKECFVKYGDKKAYVMTDVRLGDGYYHIIDLGVDSNTKDIVWGSRYGHLKFKKL